MKARLNSLSGFTLVELMVVMAIIAILATAGISAYTGYINKAILLGGRVFATKLERSFFEGAILRLDFEDNNLDTSGHNNHATAGGAYEAGANGQGVYLLGTQLKIFSNTIFDSPEFTFSFWIKPKSLIQIPGIYGGANMLLIREQPLNAGFRIGINPQGDVHFWTNQGCLNCLNTVNIFGHKVRTNQWNHVAITYDGSLATLYMNGKVDALDTGTYLPPVGESFFINSSVGYGNSDIVYDELRFYSSSFLVGDIEKMYRDGTSKYLAQR